MKPRVLYCAVGRHRWHWDGKPIKPTIKDGTTYEPQPSRLGYCVCAWCSRQSLVEKFSLKTGNSPRQCAGMTKTNS